MLKIPPELRVPYDSDVVYQPLFDSVHIATAPFNVKLFAAPIGQNDKGYEQTNMCLSGILPLGNDFYMTGVGVYFIPDNIRFGRVDVLTVLGHGFFELRIGSRRYLEMAPFAALPPPFPMYWAYDEPTLKKKLSKAKGEGVKLTEQGFAITPLYIQSLQWFGVTLRTDNYYKLSAPGTLGVILDGFLIRQSQ